MNSTTNKSPGQPKLCVFLIFREIKVPFFAGMPVVFLNGKLKLKISEYNKSG
jgi:hypothetical protein